MSFFDGYREALWSSRNLEAPCIECRWSSYKADEGWVCSFIEERILEHGKACSQFSPRQPCVTCRHFDGEFCTLGLTDREDREPYRDCSLWKEAEIPWIARPR